MSNSPSPDKDLLDLKTNKDFLLNIFDIKGENFLSLKSWYTNNKKNIGNDESKIILFNLISNGFKIINEQKYEIEDLKEKYNSTINNNKQKDNWMIHALEGQLNEMSKKKEEEINKKFETQMIEESNKLLKMFDKEINEIKQKEKENKEKINQQMNEIKKLEKKLSEQIIKYENYKKDMEIKLSDEIIKYEKYKKDMEAKLSEKIIKYENYKKEMETKLSEQIIKFENYKNRENNED